MGRSDEMARLDFAKFVLEHNQSVIGLADTKASIVLGIDGVILALLLDTKRSAALNPNLISLIAVLLCLSALFASMTIFPRAGTKNAPDTKMFYGVITEKTRDTYAVDFNSTSEKDILKDYANNIYVLATIEKAKFRYLKFSIGMLFAAFVSLCTMLIYSWWPVVTSFFKLFRI